MASARHSDPRDRILRTASELFGRHGYQAVGVDRIVEESGVAKMTLYRAFESKDDLIVACLSMEDASFWRWMRRATADVEDRKASFAHFSKRWRLALLGSHAPDARFKWRRASFPIPIIRRTNWLAYTRAGFAPNWNVGGVQPD